MQVCVPVDAGADVPHAAPADAAPLRKPLIIMTPKSLLRHQLSVSRLEELAGGGFRTVIDEIDELEPPPVTRIVLCSGKVYFDLLKARREAKVDAVAIVRLEQLYPFPSEEYEADRAQVPECARDRLVSGGAAESGRLVSDPPPPAGCRSVRSRSCCTPGGAGAAAPATGIAGAPRAAAEKSGHGGAAGRAARRDLTANACASRRLQRLKLGQDHDNRSSRAAAAGIGGRRHPRVLAQESPATPWRGTRIWSISRPTRWCSRCPRRRPAC